MADVNFFNGFTYNWAQTGSVENIQDDQWQLGWLYIGTAKPTVEQFNKVQQINDQKTSYLYRQIRTACVDHGVTPSSNDVTALSRAIDNMLPVGMPMLWPTSTPPAGFIRMTGQTIAQSQYPILFGLYGATLPNMDGLYVRGAGTLSGLTEQADAIRSHTHAATTNAAGQHGHNYTMAVNGAHNHTGTTSTAGNHQHQMRGDNIGAGGGFDAPDYKPSGDTGIIQGTSGSAGVHSHGFTTTTNGTHNHNLTITPDGAHTHNVTVSPFGSTETRPKSIAFYYVTRAG